VPASDKIFKDALSLFSSKRIFATPLFPLPHASALSPAGLKISLLISALLFFGSLMVIN
jgi:hypothetical protein